MDDIHGDLIIVSDAGDPHASIVLNRLRERGVAVFLLDFAEAPTRAAIRLSVTKQPRTIAFSGELFGVDDIVSVDSRSVVWWRRPHEPTAGLEHPAHREFVSREWWHALLGSLHAAGAHFVNCPFAQSRARLKPVQVATAIACGFTVPETIVSNYPESADALIGGGRAVAKSFEGYDFAFLPTTELTSARIAEGAAKLRETPHILQRLIEGDWDVRAIAAGETITSAAIPVIDGRIDTREQLDGIVPHTLPESVKKKIREYCSQMGLTYGAFDLRLSHDGDYVFFECNPSGQWLWLDIACDIDITSAVVSMLERQTLALANRL